VAFFNVGGGWFDNTGYKFWSNDTEVYTPIDYEFGEDGTLVAVPGTPREISGFRLVDGRASYGIGLETFALGFPIHFDWSWRTLFNRDWEDAVFSYQALVDGKTSGSDWFRKVKFSLWIGYDF
jgi:hypothetical protein